MVELGSKKKRAAKESTEFREKFEEKIKSSNEVLKLQLATLTNDSYVFTAQISSYILNYLCSTKNSTDFLITFQNVYAASRPRPAPSPSKPSDPNDLRFVTLFDRSQTLVNNALALITCFETANEKTEKCQVAELLDNEWEDETGAAARVLAIGCNVGLHKYQALLQGSGEPVVEEEDEVFVKMIYGGDENGKPEDGSEYGWGKVAKKGEKAARKFVKFQRVVVAWADIKLRYMILRSGWGLLLFARIKAYICYRMRENMDLALKKLAYNQW